MSDRRMDRRRFVAGSATLTGLAAGVSLGAASDPAGDSGANATGAVGGNGSAGTDENRGQTGHEGAGEGTLTAGVAIRDVTPANGQPFFGYARPDIFADGVSIRLFVQALVLSDGERKVALVGGDLGRPVARETVLEHARPLGFDRDTVLYATTHTHAGPDGFDDWIAGQIGDAIAAADADRRPARAAWAEADVPDNSVNRSIEAHLANYGLDIPPGEGSPDDHPVDPALARDPTLRLLRVESLDGMPIAAWTCYANHPTTFPPANTTYSADFPGVASRWFVHRFDDESPVVLHAAGKLGDVMTHYDDYGMYALAERTAVRVESAMWAAWQAAEADLSRTYPVGGRARVIEFDGQHVDSGERVASTGLVGKPILNGGENGPTPFSGLELEGERRPEWLADPVHGRKLILAPAPWSTEVEIQALRLGDRLLVTVPGEPTTEMGRRMAEAAAEAAPDDVTDVTVVGIANGYNGYFTTPEEYDQQHYEGGHTVFGKYASVLIGEHQRDLAAAFDDGLGSSPDPSGSRPSVPSAPVGDGAAEGSLVAQPSATVERMETVGLEWVGGTAGRDRPVDDPFVLLERATAGGDGEWHPVTDDRGLGFVWSEWLGHYTARFDVTPDLPTGTYRFRVNAARYELTTRSFDVVPATGLVVRGVRAGEPGSDDSVALTVLAQNPPPDPDDSLRTRARSPHGGTATIEVDGETVVATWDGAAGGWVGTAQGVTEGDVVTVPDAGLEDAFGNRSGDAVQLTVGEVADGEWPQNMTTGGGDPPGLFGIGTIPI
ncbi:hypothetical protein C479_05643 [Halovivax asiaticus JCM 14624]|uniref:Neutral/alkaline non-lysosomal ceramidase N-terminal domain-containing protein n=1 Tax=Halovivax asiaticus JCM 14624 TaxID=1227490 RepID=M0BMZ1_9EURY|nr:neutral/alkaline non-lysosomal ceramidase N-terminal domain-containing protein [Halovivax asiaticus]ELZ12266.1 hypothetical protein C479_05643 [Halovivax asiaticus JCM 14624]